MVDFPTDVEDRGNIEEVDNRLNEVLIMSNIEPREPVKGQFWFAPELGTLKIWTGKVYKTITLT